MMRTLSVVALAGLTGLVAFMLACATSRGGGGGGGFGAVDTEQFPTREQLAKVAAQELPALKIDVRADVPSWTLKGPLPDAFGHAPVAAGGLNDLLIASVSAARTSKNLECAARELAEFMVTHGEQQPEARLKSWLLVRCGVTSGDVSTQWLAWDKIPEKALDTDVWKGSKESVEGIEKMIAEHKDMHLGIAFARNTKTHKAVVLVAGSGAREESLIDNMSQIVPADAAKVIVSGTVNEPAEVIYAYATKGLLDASECELDLAVVLPRFRFSCVVDAADANARIDVGVRKKGRVLGDTVAELLVVRDVAASAQYREAIYVDATGTAATAATAATAGSEPAAAAPPPADLDVLAAINGVRAAAGHQPLRATAAQSEAVKKVAPHYFANLFADDRDPEISDVVALGLMAGWDVTELTIHDAGFATLLDVSGGGDDLLGYALDHPMHRAILLDPKMSAAAVGPVTMEGGVKGALVITYEALVPPADHAKAASEVFEKLRAVRKQRGLGVTGSIPTEKVMLDAAVRLQKGEDIEQVADAALKESVNIMQRPFTIWMMEIHDVEHMAFPDQLLTPRTTYVAISVATRKRPKSAWGSTVVLVLGFVDDARVAALGDEHSEGVVRSSR
jgi:hypothetical protein